MSIENKALIVDGEQIADQIVDVAITTEAAPVAASAEVDANTQKKIDEAVAKIMGEVKTQKIVVPAKSFIKHKSIKPVRYAEDADQAHAFGMYMYAVAGNEYAKNWCAKNIKTAMVEGSATLGAALVPEEFSSKLIDLRAAYGVVRQNADVRPMASDVLNVPKCTQNTTAYWGTENTANTVSNKTWTNVALTAKKLSVLTLFSDELNEDSLVNVGDDLMRDAAVSLAYAEDNAAFNGDGTSTYGSITGFANLCLSTYGIVTGATAASDIAWSKFVIGDFTKALGTLSNTASDIKWYCSKPFYVGAMLNLGLSSAIGIEVMNGVQTGNFLGYPVVFTEVLPRVGTAGGEFVCFVGDMNQAVLLGDRRKITTKLSDQGTVGGVELFEHDMQSIKVQERVDIACVSYGTASVQGSMVGLKSAD